MNQAKAIVTDSGNVAEEATFLGIPCITLNTFAEHPETWRTGTNELVGEDPVALGACMDKLMNGEWKQGTYPNVGTDEPQSELYKYYWGNNTIFPSLQESKDTQKRLYSPFNQKEFITFAVSR